METIQINPIRHFEIVKNDQRVELSVEEIRSLAKAAGVINSGSAQSSTHKVSRTSTPAPSQVNKKEGTTKPAKSWGISQEKKDRILAHVRRNLTNNPQSLSKLLEGATYAPNDLPKLREYIETQSDILKMSAGKLTYYFKTHSPPAKPSEPAPSTEAPRKEESLPATQSA